MNSLISAIRTHSRNAAIVLLPFLALICGTHPARANGVFGSVTNGGIVFGSVSGVGVDQYTIPMPSGTYQYLVTLWESGGHSTTSNAEFWIVRPNATATFAYPDTGSTVDLDTGTSGLSGTWTVKVDNYEGSATAAAYGLQVAWWPGTIGQPGGHAGGTMRNGETYSGTIDLGGTDFYSFQGIGSQIYTLTFSKTSGGTNFCPYVQIMKPDGTNAGIYSTCTTDGGNRFAVTGTQYIYVTNSYFVPDTGTYSIEVSGAGIDMPGQGKDDGSTCISCQQSAAAHSGEVTSTGGAATKK